jgi:hypothetical protein
MNGYENILRPFIHSVSGYNINLKPIQMKIFAAVLLACAA